MNLIYGLIDPRTLLIRYVGLSSTGMQRPRKHRYRTSGTTHRASWLRKLARAGCDYEIAVLDVASDRDELPALEMWWIAYGRALGWPLTNATDGGEGAKNPSDETRQKMRTAHLGRKPSAATIAKMSASISKARGTNESRAKTSAANRSRSPESRERTGIALKGHRVSDGHADLLRKINAEYWTPERRRALNRGRKASSEKIAKMRAAKLANPTLRDPITGRFNTQ